MIVLYNLHIFILILEYSKEFSLRCKLSPTNRRNIFLLQISKYPVKTLSILFFQKLSKILRPHFNSAKIYF